jgi:hypothetical protein
MAFASRSLVCAGDLADDLMVVARVDVGEKLVIAGLLAFRGDKLTAEC